ncbi:MAG TPA: DNA alkylation repair protein [Planctomycetaceae bacterium]|nr:DNA alkylation repair protein [Planctomycetaceae bacterium]
MTTLQHVLTELKQQADDQTRKTYLRHGAPDSILGVKVGDLKVIAKTIKGHQKLALELYDSGNPDAQYLAGMVADGAQMTKQQLDRWAKNASWHMISEYTVPGVACESKFARELAMKWIESKKVSLATSGWCTYAGIVAIRPDDELDLKEIKQLMKQIVETIDSVDDRVRYDMNSFVISVGSYVKPLLKEAKAIAKKLGTVSVDMGDTACKVPVATDYIAKVEGMGRIGKKRKTMKC